MVTVERKRKLVAAKTTSKMSRQPLETSNISQEWTVPSMTLGKNHFHFDGSTGDRPQCFLATVGPEATTTRSENQEEPAVFVLRCHWYDQGWGDSQGRILVIEQERPTILKLLSIPFRNGRLVAMSSVVKHKKQPLTLSFQTKPNKVYQFWVIVGGGGYNQLHLEDVTLRKDVHHTASPENILGLGDYAIKLPSLLKTPLDVKRKIVSFLSPIDVIHLVSSSKSLKAELAISQVATPLLSEQEIKAWTNSPHASCFAVYIPKTANELHSVLFQCTISIPDYGWWCLGPVTISIVAQNIQQNSSRPIRQLSYGEGSLVVKRSIVFGNCKTAITLAFLPKEDEFYQVWLSRDSSFVPPTSGLTIVENPRFRTIGYGNSESFLATYFGFPLTPKALTARDHALLANGMGQTIHQMMRLHELRARRFQF